MDDFRRQMEKHEQEFAAQMNAHRQTAWRLAIVGVIGWALSFIVGAGILIALSWAAFDYLTRH